MKLRWLSGVAALALLGALVPTGAQQPAPETVDLDIVHRIREMALQDSQVMNHVFQLTDVSGPRVTNSPGFFRAAGWVVDQMQEWGIEAREEEWGPFGRGWNFTRFSAHMLEPTYAPMIGFPMAWSPGTGGPVRGEVVIANIPNRGEMERYRGRLKGKVVFMGTGRELDMSTDPLGRRYTDEELEALETAPIGGRGRGRGNNAPGAKALNAARGKGKGKGGDGPGGRGQAQEFQRMLNEFLVEEGVAMVVRIGGGQSQGGTVFAQAAGSREMDQPLPPPTVALTPEHYNRVLRLLDNEIPVTMEFNVEAEILDDRTDSVNVVAELPGGAKRDEVVMIGAHLDSWQGGTGATDNAAGSAVMIEVMRILKELTDELGRPLDRTVRMALWGGEEQGLLGSRAYVDQHFANREDMKLKPEHAKLSGYFNVDNGTGKIRGVYLQGNDRMRPVFEAWFEPFHDLGAGTVSIRSTGGTDHTNFDAVGLPGFQFIQDSIEYNSRTHHSNMDVYDRIQSEDLQQMAAIVASFVYNAATRPDLLPRKPLPDPQPAKGKGKGKGAGK